MRVTQKVRIYPEPEQRQLLAKAIGCCRWWWNRALNISNQTYKETGKSISRNGLNAMLPKLKQEFEWLGTDVYSQSLRAANAQLVSRLHQLL